MCGCGAHNIFYDREIQIKKRINLVNVDLYATQDEGIAADNPQTCKKIKFCV